METKGAGSKTDAETSNQQEKEQGMDSTTTPGQKSGAGDPAPEMSAREDPSAQQGAEEDFGTLLDQSMEQKKVEVGEVVAGRVIRIGAETVTVDLKKQELANEQRNQHIHQLQQS